MGKITTTKVGVISNSDSNVSQKIIGWVQAVPELSYPYEDPFNSCSYKGSPQLFLF
ncbi:hypothetical protein GDO81_002114 [Engystomops pustulosus]|uniref:Uncharacterized protein n=1 Tax=Engystomops pustulosus TaxID=76066 RepID=A0AAV7DHG4_ENGPU|nr:hypothetical protein GDO81_002114 [Engystomops pustulosus]